MWWRWGWRREKLKACFLSLARWRAQLGGSWRTSRSRRLRKLEHLRRSSRPSTRPSSTTSPSSCQLTSTRMRQLRQLLCDSLHPRHEQHDAGPRHGQLHGERDRWWGSWSFGRIQCDPWRRSSSFGCWSTNWRSTTGLKRPSYEQFWRVTPFSFLYDTDPKWSCQSETDAFSFRDFPPCEVCIRILSISAAVSYPVAGRTLWAIAADALPRF